MGLNLKTLRSWLALKWRVRHLTEAPTCPVSSLLFCGQRYLCPNMLVNFWEYARSHSLSVCHQIQPMHPTQRDTFVKELLSLSRSRSLEPVLLSCIPRPEALQSRHWCKGRGCREGRMGEGLRAGIPGNRLLGSGDLRVSRPLMLISETLWKTSLATWETLPWPERSGPWADSYFIHM